MPAACGAPPAAPTPGGGAPGGAAPAATSTPITASSGTGGGGQSNTQTVRTITQADKNGPEYGGTFHVYAYDWPHLDVHQSLTAGLHGVAAMPYRYLLRFETGPSVNGLKIIPSMAVRWESPDPKTYIFHLRKGVKWHNMPPVNGREFTADDVIYNVNRISTPGWISAPLLEDIAKTEALDKYTVKFTLKGPSAPFLAYIANGYIKMAAEEAVDANGGDLKRGLPIGAGPFMAEDITAKVAVKMKKNPDYGETDAKGGKLPYLDGLEGVIIADSSTRFTALRTGKLDYYTCLKSECDLMKKASPEVAITTDKAYSGQQYGLKVNKKPFDAVRVRKAISLAFDRKTTQETVKQAPVDESWSHFTFMAPDESWIAPQAEFDKAWAYNLDEAKKLLAEAGYPNGFDVNFTCANYGQEYITGCEFLVDGLKKVGIKA
ncbi:MAG: ABC transporter substrate-binding protein, partial [Chloroflexi bacterium]|nr:ABC transporter substrate-binding protein [Chloroflexota bacterium]